MHPRAEGRKWRAALWLVPAAGGLFAFARPFVQTNPAWEWRPHSAAARKKAPVCAIVEAVDGSGVRLSAMPGHAIGLVGPPIESASAEFPIAEVEVGWTGTQAVDTMVRLLWQTHETPEFRRE